MVAEGSRDSGRGLVSRPSNLDAAGDLGPKLAPFIVVSGSIANGRLYNERCLSAISNQIVECVSILVLSGESKIAFCAGANSVNKLVTTISCGRGSIHKQR